ncbi:SPOR domain-containing protein [Marinobacter sp.]|uniref:SPOR domain-containing protein n=1 Tax=Marinobacter sp. TaxID=50741 RepID=UPI0019F74BF0|nr:SPOR domain-containing protein [Marinobacter sp.]MBE0484802.1 SPOR domain-containing protein [Marinobacter sp.]
MNGLKQRIIGALVLVSLAVIFVPMIFDEPHSERESRSITIPEEPPFPEVDVPAEPVAGGPDYGMTAEPESASSEPAQGFRLIEDNERAAPSQANAQQAMPQTAAPEPDPEPKPAAQQAAPEPAPEPVEETAEYTRSLEGAWVVQLGSFGNADNARRLRDNVRDMGFGAHLQQVERGDATLTRVFSGPFANKTDAEAAKKSLDEAFSLNSLVTSGGK